MKLITLIIALVLSVFVMPVSVWADFEAGKKAYEAKDYQTATRELKPLAEKGNAEAQYALSRALDKGRRFLRGGDEAMEWLEKAAEGGYVDAQYDLGKSYLKFNASLQERGKAFEWFLKAAKQGHVDAQMWVAFSYKHGQVTEENYEEAFKWYKKAAEQGDEGGMYNLGRMHRKGEGVIQDRAQAFYWYHKLVEKGSGYLLRWYDERCWTCLSADLCRYILKACDVQAVHDEDCYHCSGYA